MGILILLQKKERESQAYKLLIYYHELAIPQKVFIEVNQKCDIKNYGQVTKK